MMLIMKATICHRYLLLSLLLLNLSAMPTYAGSEISFLTNLFRTDKPSDRGNNKTFSPNTASRHAGNVTQAVLEAHRGAGLTEASLRIHCESDNTSVFVQFPGQVMSHVREYSEMIYSVDGREVGILEFEAAGKPDTLGIPQGYRAVPFLKSLTQKSSLTLEALAADGKELVSEFAIQNLDSALTDVKSECHW